MTTTIDPYLFFDGDCAEALSHYAEVLGGEIEALMKYSDAPQGQDSEHGCEPPEGTPPPEQWSDRIMHGSLLIDGQRIMASDSPPGMYDQPAGIPVAVAVNVAGPAEVDRVFAAMSEGGRVDMPPAETFWSPRFCMFVDRFGISWMVGCQPQQG
jgi:PhnB protein